MKHYSWFTGPQYPPDDLTLPALILLLTFGLVGAWIGSRKPIGGLIGFMNGTFTGLAVLVAIVVIRALSI